MKKSMLTKLFALVLTVCVVFSLAIIVSSAAEPALVATFNLGDNGSATHKDGSSAKTTYSETDGSYTLSITGGDKMYPSSIDAKGNGCIKFGTGSAAGKMSFTVPDDVTSVKLYVAKYKSNTAKIKVNETAYTLTKNSNDGAYDVIVVDTSSTKTVTFTTVSGGYRAMLNTIEFYAAGGSSAPDCEHANTEVLEAVAATCTTAGKTEGEQCADCGEIIVAQTEIKALGHTGGEATCTELAVCDECGEEYGNLVAHNYVNGECTECGEPEPSEVTLSFSSTSNCTSQSASQQIWEQNGIIFTNNKSSSTNNVALYAPVRCYAGSEIIIKASSQINKIVFDANSAAYATELKNSIGTPGGATVTVDSDKVTVEFSAPVESFTIAKLTAQVRLDSITVSFASSGSSEPEQPDHEHTPGAAVEENRKEATCTENGSYDSVVYCTECEEEISRETTEIIAPGHNYVDGKCDVCQQYKPVGYTLLTDVSNLVVGTKIIIVAKNSNYALSTNQKSNNRGQAAVTKDGNIITFGADTQVITLEAGTSEGTFAFYTGTGYLYAASKAENYLRTESEISDNSSWTISVDENGVATITANGENTHNLLKYNSTSSLFSCYASGQQDVSIYFLAPCEVHEWGVGVETKAPTCAAEGEVTYTCAKCLSTDIQTIAKLEHANTAAIGEAVDATCTTTGMTAGLKCTDCDEIIEAQTIIFATAHNYVNNTCTACGTVMVGRFYIAAKRTSGNFFWLTGELDGNNNRIVATDSTYGALPYEISTDANAAYIFVLEKLGDVYYIYAEGIKGGENYIGWLDSGEGNTAIFVDRTKAAALTMTGDTEHTMQFCFTAGETTRYLSLYGTSEKDYFAFYAGTQKQDLSFIPVVDKATPIPVHPIKSANVKLGTDLAILYNVFIPSGEPTKMVFEFGGKTFEVTEFKYTGYGIYQFEFGGIGPHQMATRVNASLYVGEDIVGTHENYSINTNLENIYDDSNENVRAVIDAARAYGVKAAAYNSATADTTVDLSGITVEAPVHTPNTSDTSKAYFKSAGVYFDVTNKIYVKFYAAEGFSITIKKGSKELGTYNADTCESLGDNMYKLYTSDITPIEFNDYFSFTISVGGEDVATLAYSVNGYAAAMQGSGIPTYVADLAKALYAYGVAVENYNKWLEAEK